MSLFRGVSWPSFWIGSCLTTVLVCAGDGRWLLVAVNVGAAVYWLLAARAEHEMAELDRAVDDARLIDAALDARRVMTPAQVAELDQLRARFRAEFGGPR